MTDNVFVRLRELPDKNGYSSESLVRAFSNIDWSQDDSLQVARDLAISSVEKAINSWLSLSDKLRIPIDQVVRNLIVCAGRKDISVYVHILHYWISRQNYSEKWARQVRKTLPKPGCSVSLLFRLLEDRRPTKGDYIRSLQEFPGAALVAILFQINGIKENQNDLKKHLIKTMRLLPVADSSAIESIISALCDVIDTLGVRELADQSTFDRFPVQIRRALLASPGQLAVLCPTLARQLNDDPWFHPDTKASLDRPRITRAALVDIQRGAFHTENFRIFCLDKPFFPVRRSALKRALSGASFLYPRYCGGIPADARGSLRDLSRYPEAVALLLLDSGLGSQEKHIDFEDLQSSLSAVLSLLSGAAIANMLYLRKSGVFRDTIIVHLNKTQSLAVVDAWLLHTRSINRMPRDFLEHWYRQRSAAEIQLYDRHCRWLTPYLAETYPKSHKLIQVLAANPKRDVTIPISRIILSNRFFVWLQNQDRQQDSLSLVQRAAKTLRYASTRDWTRDTLIRLHDVSPTATLALIKTQTRAWELRYLVERATRQTPVDEEILLCQNDNKKIFWIQYLLLVAKLRNRIPRPLRNWIESDPNRLAVALKLAPLLFCRAALRHSGMTAVLPFCLKDSRVARSVGLTRSLNSWRQLIPQVRSKYRKKPWAGAAYELALAFSLVHAGFLVRAMREISLHNEQPAGSRLDHWYRTYELPKDSGGSRTITVPPGLLKSFQRRVLEHGLNSIPLHGAATGFRPGVSIKDNAQAHCGKKIIVNVDVESCFPSVSFKQIHRACRSVGKGWLSDRAIFLLAQLCSYNGALPTGAPTSPALLNIVFRAADQAIHNVAERHGFVYTRYADDLTFSGDESPLRILPFVRDVIGDLGLRLDPQKTQIYRKGRRQMVTGLVANEKPNVPRPIRRRLRALVHHRVMGRQPLWHGRPISDNRIRGYLAYLHQLQPEEARCLNQQLDRAQNLST